MIRKIVFFLGTSLLLTGCSLPSFLRTQYAALQITTKPEAEVSIDGEAVGTTPFKSEKLKAKDYVIRLDPKEAGLNSWETTVTLQPNITTVVNYEFSQEVDTASGEIIGLEALVDKDAVELAVVTLPDNTSVNLDGQPKGIAPLKIKDIPEGDHVLTISSPGYRQSKVDVKTIKGYKLTVDVRLARESMLTAEETTLNPDEETTLPNQPAQPASPSAVPDLPYVQILQTPTGWLRVRSSPTTAEDNELTTVSPGETYPYLDSNDTGWHKIRLPDGSEGWLSGRYVKVMK